MKNKYGNKKIEIDGHKFASKDESEYYLKLNKDLQEGKILDYELQPKFELQPAFKKNGKRYRAITYTLDFGVKQLDGSIEYVDVKGFGTQQGDMRRKMFEYKYPELTLKWVSKSIKFGVDGWIDYDELKKIRRDNKKVK